MIGMTPDQVVASLGEPDHKQFNGESGETWLYFHHHYYRPLGGVGPSVLVQDEAEAVVFDHGQEKLWQDGEISDPTAIPDPDAPLRVCEYHPFDDVEPAYYWQLYR